MAPSFRRWSVAVVVVTLLASLGAVPVAAQNEAGERVVVEEGETVSEVNAVAGTVMIRGTVTGDVSAVAGNVVIEGTVEGDVSGATGNLRITGTVEGDVTAGAGNLYLGEGGTVGGDVEAGAMNVRIEGRIEGDATLGAETISLGENATITGTLVYDGTLTGNREAVEGEITQDSSLGAAPMEDVEPIATVVFTLYGFLLNFVLGAVLLLLFPWFSDAVAERAASGPLRSILVGLVVLVAVPVLLALVAITIVGIPLSFAGAVAFALFAWIGLVYGWFSVGVWLLSLVDASNRWAGLLVGLLVGVGLSLIPVVGWLLNLLVFLLGVGALSSSLLGHRRRPRASPSVATPGQSTTD